MCVATLIDPHPDLIAGTFYTTPLFWDCNCEEEYIHPATDEACPACNTRREDAPDARVEEIFRYTYAFHLPPVLVNTLAAAAEAVAPALTAGIAIPF
jgi:hypothetical protein